VDRRNRPPAKRSSSPPSICSSAERGSADLIRTDAAELRITGRFELSAAARTRVEEVLGAPPEDDQVVVTRRLGRNAAVRPTSTNSRSRSAPFGNSARPSSISTASAKANRCSNPLTNSTSSTPSAAWNRAGRSIRNWPRPSVGCARPMRSWPHKNSNASANWRWSVFERDELDSAALEPGEAEQLARERERLTARPGASGVRRRRPKPLVRRGRSVVETLGRLLKEAQGWLPLEPALQEVIAGLEGLVAEAHEVSDQLRGLAERWEAEPARLEEVEDRLRKLRRLEAKYGRTGDEPDRLSRHFGRAGKEAAAAGDRLGATSAELGEAFIKLKKAGDELSKHRKEAAKTAGDRGAEAIGRPRAWLKRASKHGWSACRSATTR